MTNAERKDLNPSPGFHARRLRAWRMDPDAAAIHPDLLLPLWNLLLEQRLVDALLKPPIVSRPSGGRVTIEALGTIRYSFDHDGMRVRSSYATRPPGRWQEAPCVSLERPLQGAFWIRARIATQQLPLYEALSGGGACPVEPLDGDLLVRQLADALWKRVEHSAALRCQRRWLLRAFPLLRPVMRLALRRDQELTSQSYNRAWTFHARVTAARNLNPRLIGPMAWLVRHGKLKIPPDLGRFRAALTELGLTRAGCKVLWRHGWSLLRPVHAHPEFRRHPAALLVSLANLTAVIGDGRLLPPALVKALMDAEAVRQAETGPRPMPARLVLEARRRLEALEPQRRAGFLDGEFAEVMHWWYVSEGQRHHMPARAPWGWFRRSSDEWAGEARLASLAATGWEDPSPVAEVKGYRVIPLRNWRDILLEGRAMRHCLGTPGHVGEFQTGRLRAYSMRDAGTGKRVATFTAVRFHGLFMPNLVRGFANCRPSGEVQLAAWNYCITFLFPERRTGVSRQ